MQAGSTQLLSVSGSTSDTSFILAQPHSVGWTTPAAAAKQRQPFHTRSRLLGRRPAFAAAVLLRQKLPAVPQRLPQATAHCAAPIPPSSSGLILWSRSSSDTTEHAAGTSTLKVSPGHLGRRAGVRPCSPIKVLT